MRINFKTMIKTVKEKLSETLFDFSQEQSDNVSVEASSFEQLEKDYKAYMLDDKGEPFIIELVEQMCVESLPPNLYSYWLIIKHQLSINRIGLIEDNQLKSEAIQARNKMTKETLEYLKNITRDSDADTPDWSDALACCHLD